MSSSVVSVNEYVLLLVNSQVHSSFEPCIPWPITDHSEDDRHESFLCRDVLYS